MSDTTTQPGLPPPPTPQPLGAADILFLTLLSLFSLGLLSIILTNIAFGIFTSLASYWGYEFEGVDPGKAFKRWRARAALERRGAERREVERRVGGGGGDRKLEREKERERRKEERREERRRERREARREERAQRLYYEEKGRRGGRGRDGEREVGEREKERDKERERERKARWDAREDIEMNDFGVWGDLGGAWRSRSGDDHGGGRRS